MTILSLISVSGIPEFGTDYDDKIYHLFAYFILTSVWYFAIGETINKRQILYLTLSCIGFGIIIEAIQGKLTVNRAGDFFDIVANLVGVFFSHNLYFNETTEPKLNMCKPLHF